MIGSIAGVLLLLSATAAPLAGQLPAALVRERAEFARWLATAPLSPYAILALQPVGNGISIGAAPSDIPLPIPTSSTVREELGIVTLTDRSSRRVLPRGRPVRVERFTLIASGAPGRAVVAAYGDPIHPRAPTYFPYVSSLVLAARMEPPERRGTFRTLGLDGAETEASETGFVEIRIGESSARLRVYRLGPVDDEESELAIFFRDATNGRGSYPAGRFVVLEPMSSGEFRLDFNRARSPFCAYSSVYPCPAPWPGNQIPAAVPAGERYRHEGLERPH